MALKKRSSRNKSANVGFLSPYAFGHAFGLVSVIALMVHAVMYWFASYNAAFILQQYPLPFSFDDWTIILGVIQTYVLSYIGGWIFARIYNHALVFR